MDFDSSFDKFLESREYDSAEDALYSFGKEAFLAGWLAAGGSLPENPRSGTVSRFSPPAPISDSLR